MMDESEATVPEIQHSVEHLEGGRWRVSFLLPQELHDVCTARPVLACGGQFELRSAAGGRAVETEFSSANPESTVEEIKKRLVFRLSNEAIHNPCFMS